MKQDIRFEHIKMLAAVLYLSLGSWLWPMTATADLPPGEPTFFAGNPDSKQLAFRFRIGLKVLGWTEERTGVYGIYSQSSFWYLEHGTRGYTVESNYEPEIQFFATGNQLAKAADWWPRDLDFGFSYSHHSNGTDGDLSRTLNHLNGGLYLGDPATRRFSASVVGWWPFNLDANNQDIASYAGNGRITVNLRPQSPVRFLGRTQFYAATCFTFDNPGGGVFTSLETSMSFAPGWLARPPFAGPEASFAFFLQWVVGKGESLNEYQKFQNILRFGISLW